MTDHSPITTLPQSNYSIKEAAALVGKSDITLVRWCRDGVLANAGKVPGPKGDEWSIPADDLAQVVHDKGLTIHLDRSETDPDPSPDRANDQLIEALQENAELREKTGHLTGQVDNITNERDRIQRERDQARSDLEHEKTGHEQTSTQLTESDKAKSVAEARVEELRSQLEHAQENAKEATQNRDSLDLEHRELQKANAESLSAVSADLEAARNAGDQAVGERDELTKKLQAAEASMGWWTRRRYEKRS